MKQKITTIEEFWKDILNLKEHRLISIVAMDEIGFFSVVYVFERNKEVFGLRVQLTKQRPLLPSVHLLFPNSIYYECEIHDFFGIEFEDNHRLHDKLFLPDDFADKPPLLKK